MLVCAICMRPLRGCCANPFECVTALHALHWGCFVRWTQHVQARDGARVALRCPTCRAGLCARWRKARQVVFCATNARVIDPPRLFAAPA